MHPCICREVLALEHMIITFVQLLDPIFHWTAKSATATQFLELTDGILHALDYLDDSTLPLEHAESVQEARRVRVQMDKGLGRRWLFRRSIPLTESARYSADELCEMVRATESQAVAHSLTVR